MDKLPKTKSALLVRTDFTDDAAWESLCQAVQEPNKDGFRAYVDCLSDRAYEGLTVDELVPLAPKGHRIAFLADRVALFDPERPVLVVTLKTEPGKTLRVIPSQMCVVENNLWTGNMHIDEFVNYADPDGIFRGFRPPV